MPAFPSKPTTAVSRALAFSAAGLAFAAGVSSLVGWVFDLPRLTDWAGQGISMFPNAAVCGILCGAALVVLTAQPCTAWCSVVRWLTGAVIVISGLTLLEHLFGVNLGIDTLLIERTWGQHAASAPMRMGYPASFSFLLLAIACVAATGSDSSRAWAAALAVGPAAIASLSLTGYIFGADQLFGVAKYTGISLLTSTILAALSVGLMAVIPEHGFVAALRRDDAGGWALRRLIIPVLAIPLLIGWLRMMDHRQGLYDPELGMALRTLAEAGLLFVLLWWTANSISRHAASAHDAQTRLAAIVESSDDAIVSKTLDGFIKSWNAGAERTFGYSAAEVIGKHISIIIPPDRLVEEVEILARLNRGERIEHFETLRVRKGGGLINVSITVSPVHDQRGQVIGASKIARDISDRRRAEDRLRAIVEATPECVKIVAPDGSLEFMNNAGVRMVEGDSEQALRGACVFELIAPDHRAEWIERHRRVCAGERMNWEFEIIGLKGTHRWMETHAVPLPLADGRIGQLAVTRESTARKLLEREREQLLESERAARNEAERASHLKDEFLATLSHELRTPLNAILGWSQLLNLTSDEADLEQGLDAIQRNARAQAQLIEDLLDMSRIIAGKVRLDVQPTELSSVILAAIESISPAAEAKNIRVRTVLDQHAGTISGDPTRLQQVVWNLLTNAIKFTPKGGKVDVVLARVNSHVEITVHDDGIGIAPDHVPLIFERFRQVDSSTNRTHGGLGLGLSIVKQLVELHGGTISADSAGEGQGATFVVALPLSPLRASEDRVHPAATKSPAFDFGEIDLAGIDVLVIDDEPDARALVERVLVGCGANVYSAASAAEGLERLRTVRPHVLVSDIGMPGTDGYQFMREVRSLGDDEGGRIPAIALTAFARSEDRMRAMLAGYQVHLAKPIEPQELAVTVRTFGRRANPPIL